MFSPSKNKRWMPCDRLRRAREAPTSSGAALFLTLILLVIITIIVVGFTVSMRTERMAANSMAENERCKFVVQSALAHATSLLASNIPDPAAPGQAAPSPAFNWFVNPGRLTLVAQDGTRTAIPLHSGEALSEQSNVSVNLNALNLVTKTHPITGGPDPMWVAWLPMIKDPGTAPSAINPLVGRYAFWIDDESAKINFNVARGKPDNMTLTLPTAWSTLPPKDIYSYLSPTFTIGTTEYVLGQPASINIDSLGVDVDALHSDISKFGFARTPEAIKSYVSDPDTFFENNKFSLTAFSRSPEFNVFGKPRIFMAASPQDLGSGPMFQHALHPEQPVQFFGGNAKVGTNAGSSIHAMRALREPVFQNIAKLLDRSDWPGFSGKQFEWVNASNGDEETDQIAANIIGMGYWAATPTGSPNLYTNTFLRYDGMAGAYASQTTAPNSYLWKGPVSGRPTLPFYVGPQLTEVACTILPVPLSTSGTSPDHYLQVQLGYELYLPPGGFSDDSTQPRTFKNSSTANNYVLTVIPTACSIEVNANGTSGTNAYTSSDIQAPSSLISSQQARLPDSMPIDSYTAVLASPLYVSKSTLPIPAAVSTSQRQTFSLSAGATIKIKLRVAITQRTALKPMMVAPIYVPNLEGGNSSDLKPAGGEADTTLEFTITIPPLPDTVVGHTESLEIDDARTYAVKTAWKPFVATTGESESLGFENSHFTGSPSGLSQWAMWNLNQNGSSGSPNDPSYIPSLSTSNTLSNFRGTSVGMFSFIPTGMKRGLSWKTLRFHKHSNPSGELPDWLVLDLLAPAFPPVNSSTPTSYMNSTAGKINLNSKIYPENPFFVPPERKTPLNALFEYMPQGSEIVDEIVKYQDEGGYFDYIGRICEVSKVADVSQGITEFDQEVIVRNLAGLFTTQSNVFGVWGVAQTVKKKPGATTHGGFEAGDIVTGEKRFYAVIERSVWPGRDGVPGAGTTSDGIYSELSSAPTTANSPGSFPSGPWVSTGSTALPSVRWGRVDGPQSPESYNAAMGTRPYQETTLAEADNPLAPVFTYRIIYFQYLQ